MLLVCGPGGPYKVGGLGAIRNMPRNKEHIEYTETRLGIRYNGDIDRWMDAPWRKYGESHRMFRHEPSVWLPYRYIKKYGKRLARRIVWCHLELDFGESLF